MLLIFIFSKSLHLHMNCKVCGWGVNVTSEHIQVILKLCWQGNEQWILENFVSRAVNSGLIAGKLSIRMKLNINWKKKIFNEELYFWDNPYKMKHLCVAVSFAVFQISPWGTPIYWPRALSRDHSKSQKWNLHKIYKTHTLSTFIQILNWSEKNFI